jgi:hypothetical protein
VGLVARSLGGADEAERDPDRAVPGSWVRKFGQQAKYGSAGTIRLACQAEAVGK